MVSTDASDHSQVPWAEGPVRAFLSHESEYKAQAVDLKEQLQRYGIAAFVAHEDITPTLAWQDIIRRALKEMHVMMPLVTLHFHQSAWTNQEVGYAVAREVPVVPVRLGSDPAGFIGGIQGVPGAGKTAAQLAHTILETMLRGRGELRDLGKEAFISAVSTSRSWNHSNLLAKLLPCIDALASAQVDLVVRAFDNNGEVNGAFEFNPGLARQLTRITGDHYAITADRPPRVMNLDDLPF